ncbi:unnamed protein product, partial [Gulo gulo]
QRAAKHTGVFRVAASTEPLACAELDSDWVLLTSARCSENNIQSYGCPRAPSKQSNSPTTTRHQQGGAVATVPLELCNLTQTASRFQPPS